MTHRIFRLASSLFLALAFAFAGFSPVLAAGECYVKWDASGANNGLSWTNAYTNLQSALGNVACTEIWVAAGTYKPTSATNRVATFQLKSGVQIYGGFDATETQRNQRNPTTNVTTLSGDIGTQSDNSDNSYHVTTGSGTDATTVLDGFTISDGNANALAGPDNTGGGMYNESGSPALANIIFSGNNAFDGGGIFNLRDSSPTLTDVIFNSNSAGNGGGVYNFFSSNPVLTRVTFTNNSSGSGGGMYNRALSNPILFNVTFAGNSANSTTGGGMYNEQSSPQLTDVAFIGNRAGTFGGGISNSYFSSPNITNVTFTNNSAASGGGMFNDDNSNPTVTNSTFSGNHAGFGGGGMFNRSNSSPTVINSTFSGNSADFYGGAIYLPAIVRNSILWGNIAPSGPIFDGGTSIVSDSVVEGGFASGTNIIDTDPILGTLGNYGGYTDTFPLQAGSSAIDTANNTYCPTTDQRGVARPQGARCDIGAFELEATGGGGTEVTIDIKPGRFPNRIKLTRNVCRDDDNLYVAILTTPTFNARTVDVSTLQLGDPNLSGKATPIRSRVTDVDRDGDRDMVLTFTLCSIVTNGALNINSTEMVLTGTTLEGVSFTGRDSVKVVR